MDEIAIKIDHISKEYRLGAIGGGTLRGDLQSWMARIKGKEDPNSKIGSDAAAHTGEHFLALDDISFTVKKGEALGIIGHNGAGKSTLLKLLSRVTAPTKGTISYNGRVASMLEVGTGFHPELTGRENVYMNGAILGMTKAEIDRKFDQIVEFAEMEKFIDTPVKRYSSGMYVKLAFAVAAHLDSEIMIMDEVLAVGDMKFQQKCLGKMGDAANSEGRTVLYVSHNMNTIRQLCTRCIVLDHGKLVFDGDVEKAIEIYSQFMMQDLLQDVDLSIKNHTGVPTQPILRMTKIHFDKPTVTYKTGDTMGIIIYTDVYKHCKDTMFRIIISAADDTPVAMATTVNPFEIKKGKFSTNISLLGIAPGKYKLKLAMYLINEYGTDQHLDVIVNAASIRIEANSTDTKLIWNKTYWGYLQLPNLIVNEN